MPRSDDDSRRIERVVQSLHARLGPAIDLAELRAHVDAEFARYEEAAIRTFVPILVERAVRSRLARAAGVRPQ